MTELVGARAIGREAIAALIPHQGTMCLLERVLDWDTDHIRLATATHRLKDNPLRSNGRLRAVHLCEYGAQAMAVHGGLLAQSARSRAQPGLLVSLREVHLHRDYIEDLAGELEVEARRLVHAAGGWQYAFAAHHAGKPLAVGRAAVAMRTAA